EPDVRGRVRYAITLMFLGDDREAARALGPSPDPTPWSAFIAEFAQWHGDLTRLPAILRRLPDDRRAGLCLAAGRAEQQSASAAEREAVGSALRDLYVSSPDGGVHAACGHALGLWRVEPPP